jgi:hypothetical protein
MLGAEYTHVKDHILRLAAKSHRILLVAKGEENRAESLADRLGTCAALKH